MSDFNKIIRSNFDDLFLSAGFLLEEGKKDFVSYSSAGPSYRFAFDSYSREKSFSVNFPDIDKMSPTGFICENFILEEFLKIEPLIIFREATQEEIIDSWAKNILTYFNEFRESLLGKNKVFFSKLNDFAYAKTVQYNKSLGIIMPDKSNN